jgi:hypothetical protein
MQQERSHSAERLEVAFNRALTLEAEHERRLLRYAALIRDAKAVCQQAQSLRGRLWAMRLALSHEPD